MLFRIEGPSPGRSIDMVELEAKYLFFMVMRRIEGFHDTVHTLLRRLWRPLRPCWIFFCVVQHVILKKSNMAYAMTILGDDVTWNPL